MAILSNPFVALLVVIGILVTVHELGHFLVGRFSGIAVEAFSVGFGPALLHRKVGPTTYKIGILPFGGYVKFYGMIPSERVPDDIVGKKFCDATYPQRVATLAAGPIANLLLAIVVYATLGMSGIPHPQAIVGEVQPGSSAQKAGLQFKDQILAIGNEKISTWNDMRDIIARSAGKTLDLKVLRNGQEIALSITPDEADGEDIIGRKQKVGRAGVARGAVPAIVAVSDPKSVAGHAGITTGTAIRSVSYADKKFEIKHWQELVALLPKLRDEKVQKIDLDVASTHKDATPDLSQAKSLSLNISALQSKASAGKSGKELAEQLGLSDAQLVVGDWQQLGDQGLQKNDIIVSFDGQAATGLHQLAEMQQTNKKSEVAVVINRAGEKKELPVKLKGVERQLPSGREEIFLLAVTTLGTPVEPEVWIERYSNPIDALWFGTKEALYQAVVISKVVGLLFAGELPLKALGGPIMIANAAGEAAQAGWQAFAGTLGIISINLCIFNAIPLPLFDGGQIVLATVEAIRRRRLSDAAIENYQKLGFALLMALIVLATHNDLTRYWAAMVKSITGSAG